MEPLSPFVAAGGGLLIGTAAALLLLWSRSAFEGIAAIGGDRPDHGDVEGDDDGLHRAVGAPDREQETPEEGQGDGRLPDELSLHFLESGIVGRSEPSDKRLAKATEAVTTAAAGIRAGAFAANPGAVRCGFCPFREICPDAART